LITATTGNIILLTAIATNAIKKIRYLDAFLNSAV